MQRLVSAKTLKDDKISETSHISFIINDSAFNMNNYVVCFKCKQKGHVNENCKRRITCYN